MAEPPQTSVVLATFEPRVALAVVAVLRRHGLPARTAADAVEVGHGNAALPGEAAVLVPAGRRDEAFALLAASMEDVAEATAEDDGGDARGGVLEGESSSATADGERPLVFERLRRFGGLALLLVPLLIITLQAPPATARYAAVVVIGALVVLVALRDRWRPPS